MEIVGAGTVSPKAAGRSQSQETHAPACIHSANTDKACPPENVGVERRHGDREAIWRDRPEGLSVADTSHEYLRISGVLELLPISRRTLARWMESGMIPHIRAGARLVLFKRRDVERMLQRLTVGRAS